MTDTLIDLWNKVCLADTVQRAGGYLYIRGQTYETQKGVNCVGTCKLMSQFTCLLSYLRNKDKMGNSRCKDETDLVEWGWYSGVFFYSGVIEGDNRLGHILG